MERINEASIRWNRSYGWRSGAPYVEQDATAADVIRFERGEHGNALDVPDFLLDELDRQHYKARDVRWVCRTRQHAQRYGGSGIGQPYREKFGPNAVVLAMDHEEETGYLVLFDASRLDPAILKQYVQYRQGQPGWNLAGGRARTR